MALTLELIAGNSPTIQRYVRGALDVVGAPVGSPIAGVAQVTNTWVYDFSMVGVAYDDYWVQLDGISTPDGLPFPFQHTANYSYYADFWWQLDQQQAIENDSAAVAASSEITSPIIIGDDYLATISRAFQWTIAAPTGFVLATSVCKFGGAYKTNAWLVTGTVSDAGFGNWLLSFDLPKASTQSLDEGYYSWSVEIATAAGLEYTRVRSGRNVLLVDKQT